MKKGMLEGFSFLQKVIFAIVALLVLFAVFAMLAPKVTMLLKHNIQAAVKGIWGG